VSEAFLRRQNDAAPVFENSTVNVLRVSRPRPASAGRVHQHLVVLPLPAGWTAFEHELKVKGLPASVGKHFFTESLILAQDERWRRA
jgi:hypothetical protein